MKHVGTLYRVEYVLRNGVVRQQTYRESIDAERYVDQLKESARMATRQEHPTAIVLIESCRVALFEDVQERKTRYSEENT